MTVETALPLAMEFTGSPQSQMTLWGEDEQRSKWALLFIGKRVIWSLRGRVCVQSISCSLQCRWFRAAVLPLDESLETALLHQKEQKRCAVCGQPFLPSSNRAKHCKACAAIVHRRQRTLSDRKRRATCGQLEAKKPWFYGICKRRSTHPLSPPNLSF